MGSFEGPWLATVIAGGQERGEPGRSWCCCALTDELLPSPAGRTASAQESLSLDMLKWDLISRRKKKLRHTWKSPRTSMSSEALPHSTSSVEKLQ